MLLWHFLACRSRALAYTSTTIYKSRHAVPSSSAENVAFSLEKLSQMALSGERMRWRENALFIRGRRHVGAPPAARRAAPRSRQLVVRRPAAAVALAAASNTNAVVGHCAQQLVQSLGSALHLWMALVVSHCAGGG